MWANLHGRFVRGGAWSQSSLSKSSEIYHVDLRLQPPGRCTRGPCSLDGRWLIHPSVDTGGSRENFLFLPPLPRNPIVLADWVLGRTPHRPSPAPSTREWRLSHQTLAAFECPNGATQEQFAGWHCLWGVSHATPVHAPRLTQPGGCCLVVRKLACLLGGGSGGIIQGPGAIASPIPQPSPLLHVEEIHPQNSAPPQGAPAVVRLSPRRDGGVHRAGCSAPDTVIATGAARARRSEPASLVQQARSTAPAQ